jgi:hypothetical protein
VEGGGSWVAHRNHTTLLVLDWQRINIDAQTAPLFVYTRPERRKPK